MAFPHYKQLDSMDCGPTCLKIVARFYGKYYSLQSLREKCHITKEGVSLLGISDAAESIGFHSVGVKLTWEQLRDEMPLPCIIHWKQNHFVVVYNIKKTRLNCKIFVSDPAVGLLHYDEKQFLHSWLSDAEFSLDKPSRLTPTINTTHSLQSYGVALLIETTPKFYQDGGEEISKVRLVRMLAYFRPYTAYIIQVFLAMLIASIINLLLPFITQSIVDTGIGTTDLPFIVMLLVAQFVLIIGQMCSNLIRSWLMLHITARISISLISGFLHKLMRLPIAFFESKLMGDIMQRIGDYGRIQAFLTSSVLSMVVSIISIIVYGIIMAGYNLGIFMIFLAGSALYIIWIILFLERRRNLDYVRFQESATNQSNIVQLINGMQDIKLNNCENQKRWEWERIQAKLFKVSVKSLSLGQIQEIGGTFIDQSKNIIISFLAADAVIKGDITLGVMVALQYIIGQLNAPILQFVSFVQEAQDANISLERLEEVQSYKDEEPDNETKIQEIPDNADIIFRNVTFQYSTHSSKVLDGISFVVPANKTTAIVGASGSGKSTILKMMLDFYQPINGCITLGNVDLNNYSERCWRNCCGSVMQDGYIFSDTIAGNIGISDETPDMERIRKAADVSNIKNWVEQLPRGYNTRIGANGQGLSAGQKQRILIARAVYKNAKYIFFDEATNSLDANNEKTIMENLELFFKNKTVIIVAHRLSTIRNADNIIVLSGGHIVEEGTHDHLIGLKGKYYELIKKQFMI